VAVFSAASAVGLLYVRERIPAFGGESDSEFSVVAAADSADFKSVSESFSEGRATAFMGGIRIDLVDVSLSPGAHLVLRAFMGGIDVIVPSGWRVEVAGRSVMGGVANLSDPDALVDDAPVLLVDALAIMGGIEIHTAEAPHGG